MATPYGFDSRQQHHKAKRKACRTGMPFAVRRENPICANLSSPMLPCPVWTPRCLRSILSFPPAGCTSICVKTKSRWMEKSFRSLHACHAAAPCVFFCRICFWISRTARYFFPQGRSCAPFMKTATFWLPTSPPDFL